MTGAVYWGEPQAVVNRDLTRILYATSWESNSAPLANWEIYLPRGTVPGASPP